MKQIRKQCNDGVRYTEALKHIFINGIERKIPNVTIDNWRHKKPKTVGRYIDACIHQIDETKVDRVENKFEERLLNGEATSAEYIFYLVNRRPDRWKNNYKVEHSGKVDGEGNKFLIQFINKKEDIVKDAKATSADIRLQR
ncbi:MAG: hypothetical protein FJ241_11795 [Nitrospira sp.]|nr:hypothetical protein [Nitrospira sp.]